MTALPFTPDRWRVLSTLLDRVLDAAPAERHAMLDVACVGDACLREEIERLLDACERDDATLDRLTPEHFASLLGIETEPTLPWLDERYVIERELGRGGMATVYLARDRKHDRDVAIKVLHPELSAIVGEERFLAEIRVTARLQHPHIVPLFDSGAKNGRLYFVMPYIAGESLRDRLERERTLPPALALRIARQVASALACAHRANVIHRDVKPENILLLDDQALVADFGIALTTGRSGGRRISSPGLLIGTRQYMSPEQTAANERIDARSDVYALGLVLHEMLTGSAPRRVQSGADSLGAGGELPWSRLSDVPNGETFVQVMRSALATSSSDRFGTADEFAHALESIEGTLVHAARAEPAQFARPRRFVRPHGWKPRAFALFLLLITILGILVGTRWSGRAGAPIWPTTIAVLPFEHVGDSTDAYFTEGIADEIRTKLSSLAGLEVIADGSSDRYRGTQRSQPQIARELGVRYLLVGKVRWQTGTRAPRHMRLTIELVETHGERAPTIRWRDAFDSGLDDVLELQTDVAASVAGALGVALAVREQTSLAARPTRDFGAYDAYLRGLALQRAAGGASPHHGPAVAALQDAVRRDSNFALAWAALGYSQSLLVDGGDLTQAEAARRSVERALVLAPELPEAYGAMAFYYMFVQNDASRALEAAHAGLRLRPNDAESIFRAAVVEGMGLGRWDEALPHARRATRLDPRSQIAANMLALYYESLGRYREARVELDRALAFEPDNFGTLDNRVQLAIDESDVSGARALLRRTSTLMDSVRFLVLVSAWNGGRRLWLLDSVQQHSVRTLPPSAFKNRQAWAFAMSRAYALVGDRLQSRAYTESALAAISKEHGAVPREPWAEFDHLNALALAARHAEVVPAAERMLAHQLERRHMIQASFYRFETAKLMMLVGETGRAIELLEQVHPSAGSLRLDPAYAALRGIPRFERLLASAR